mmetsp:Transcript_106576/g.188725  ORF Transcript_106576/g.188725 Transcript_106576/m.188725 type:complete len:366 (-) Transcript_106576:15-1112(-)
MYQCVIVLACLVCLCHGWRTHESQEQSEARREPSKALATFLVAHNPAAAFSPCGSACLPTARKLHAQRSALLHHGMLPGLAAQSRTSDPVMVGLVGQVLALPTLYALMSLNEYATHRWYQHEEFNRDNFFQRFCQRVAKIFRGRPLFKDGRRNTIKIRGGGHVEHHAETYDDMSLKKDPKWRQTAMAASLDNDRFRGCAFTWSVTGLMTVQMLPTTLPAFALLGFNLLQTFAVLLPGMLLHALVWNMLHPPMHGLPAVPASFGAPSFLLAGLRNTAYFRYIYKNHQGHHVLGGRANYNVCCPLTDHLLGTYVPASVWSKRMRAVPGPQDTERWGFPVEPKGVPQAPVIGAGKATAEDLTPTALAR